MRLDLFSCIEDGALSLAKRGEYAHEFFKDRLRYPDGFVFSGPAQMRCEVF